MNRIYLLNFFVFVISVKTIAQISITKDDLPSSGEKFFMSKAIDPLIDYSTTGTNIQWDFSSLSRVSNESKEFFAPVGLPTLVNIAYGPFASTRYKASYYFPNNTLPFDQVSDYLPIQINNINQFVRLTDTHLNLIGYSASINGQAMPIKSDTIETNYNLPLNYGDSYSSSGYTNLDLSMFVNARWMQARKRNSVVDGWGKITTPFGTFDALRIKHEITELDSIFYDSYSLGLNVPKTYEYEWLAKGEKIPILKIVTSVLLGVESVVSIEYKDHNYLSADSISLNEELTIFPNPALDKIKINWGEGYKFGSICDIHGKLLKTFSFLENECELDVVEFQQGLYFLTLEKDGQIVTNKFEILK